MAGGSGCFSAWALPSFPDTMLIVREGTLKLARERLELSLIPKLWPFRIGSCHWLIGETIRRRPRRAHEVLRLGNVGPNPGAHQSVERRAARLCLLRMSELAKRQTNSGEHRRRPPPDMNVLKQDPFHMSMRAQKLCLVVSTDYPSLLCRNRDKTICGGVDFAIPEVAFSSWCKSLVLM